ncbi:rhodanese-like domain-containing protein [Ligilactobacillus sp. WILCCON 0076]|uniref:Rhodanese-like domain-containing protein n=1 Tax=Ligilactobacillus ubinensis TaxID=2876789 RepID=A0A9X2FKZ3_9LACO|nr:rhodanese-like domain-containing protein [Ligilactobacillus ubinensis]MCP0887124.1 rhodanese-like domain-containing protein [Ligilactobacillus ubinensis]
MFSFFQKIPSITTRELADKLANNITLLDVRTPQEYRSGHISGSKNVPLNKIANYSTKAKEVFVICQSGMRSKQASKVLLKKGYQVVNVRGGMNQWSGRIVGGK